MKIALLISAIFFSQQVYSQNLLELLPGAESLTFNERTGAQILKGNVKFQYQGAVMYCDSAYYYQKTKTVHAYSNIHLNQKDTLNLFCDSLHYDGNTELAKLWGNVRFRDQEYKLETDSMDYNAASKYAVYRNGGVITSINSDERLTSKVGYYHPDIKTFFFKDSVKYTSSENRVTTDTLQFFSREKKAKFFGPTNIYTDSTNHIYCERGLYFFDKKEAQLAGNAYFEDSKIKFEADSIYYNSSRMIGEGFENVTITDTINHSIFKANYAYSNDSTGYSVLIDSALVMQFDNNDTLYLHADTLQAFRKDSVVNILGYYGVRFLNSEMQGRCDSLFYSKQDSIIKMFSDPILWNDKNQITGDSIFLINYEGEMKRMHVYNNSFIVSEVDTIGYYNQIVGRNMLGLFKDNKLKRVHVTGNGKTIYYPESESKTDSTITIERSGMNRVYCSSIRIDLDSNSIDQIAFIDKPEAIYYPLNKLNPEEQFIKGFQWLYALKPKTWEDLFK
jgi:lipopolysaccharide export system protein LptA